MYIKITVVLNFLILALIGASLFISHGCKGEGCLIWGALIVLPALLGVFSLLCAGCLLIRDRKKLSISFMYKLLLIFFLIIYILLFLMIFIFKI